MDNELNFTNVMLKLVTALFNWIIKKITESRQKAQTRVELWRAYHVQKRNARIDKYNMHRSVDSLVRRQETAKDSGNKTTTNDKTRV